MADNVYESGSLPLPTRAKILIVDDQPVNVRMLEYKLAKEGMVVTTASNGKQCLDHLERETPDLILLDIMMPDLDGLELCRKIRAEERLRGIPIIFITARTTREGRIAGLEIGGDDYITKPIDLEETMARIRTQLRIRENHRYNLELQGRLAETRHAAAIGALTAGLAHNLNNLLGVVIGCLDLLRSSQHNPDAMRNYTGLMEKPIKRMVEIVRQLTALTYHEAQRLSPIALDRLLHGAIERFRKEHYPQAEVTLDNPCPDQILEANAEAFEDALVRLLCNGWESYPTLQPGPRPLEITVERLEGSPSPMLLLRVLDRGAGLHPDIAAHAFEPFVSSHTAVGRGLGLTIARHHMRCLGGELTLDNRPEGGVAATIRLPLGKVPETALD